MPIMQASSSSSSFHPISTNLSAGLKPQRSYLPVVQDDAECMVNPLLNQTAPITSLEFMKRIFVGIFLLPLRIVFTLFNVILVTIIVKIFLCGVRNDGTNSLTDEPLTGWRANVASFVGFMGRLELFVMGFYWIRVKGKSVPKSEAPIIVSNHISGLVEGFYFGKYAKLAEASYIANPFFALLMRSTQGMYVDRNDPRSRSVAKQALQRRADDPRWPRTMIFPEGICTNGQGLVQFKLGAFSPGVPVQPVVVSYPFWFNDPSFTIPHSSSTYLLGVLLQFVNFMEVEWLPVYTPSAEEVADPVLFAGNVQRVMATALGVPATKHSSEDLVLCMKAQGLSFPAEVGLVEWQSISEHLSGVRVRDAAQVLERFRSFDEDAEGMLDFQSFARAMRNRDARLSDTELASMFDVLDTSGDGYVDFREFLLGVAVLNGHGPQQGAAGLKWAFDCLAGNQAFITRPHFDDIMVRCTKIAVPRQHLDRLFLEADRSRTGRISRDDFITFASAHANDLQLHPANLLKGMPPLLALEKPTDEASSVELETDEETEQGDRDVKDE
eukprot:TRINITY_DN12441_c0_g1_i1.p1 TRINITY_DN12441_c0_g1~~TRINITY_DN12441_c0_g1_i1.p1  ORF type:complete len:554 (+),score=94.75 TRINITY_DN12441_c0_g1_i1:85-1746(+)